MNLNSALDTLPAVLATPRAALQVMELTDWILTFLVPAGVLMVAYHSLMRLLSTDENSASQHAKNLRTAVVGVMLALGAKGTVDFVQYFATPYRPLITCHASGTTPQPSQIKTRDPEVCP